MNGTAEFPEISATLIQRTKETLRKFFGKDDNSSDLMNAWRHKTIIMKKV